MVNEVARAGGVLVIPAFAVGRAQVLLQLFHELRKTHTIPRLPIYVDSPMAARAAAVFQEYRNAHCLTAEETAAPGNIATFVEGPEDSMALAGKVGPMIILSASGTATGGRVLHHLKTFAPDPRNALLFTGFQAPGTRGEAIVNGADAVKIHGHMVPIRARVRQLQCRPAHADHAQLTAWLGQMANAGTGICHPWGNACAGVNGGAHRRGTGVGSDSAGRGDTYTIGQD